MMQSILDEDQRLVILRSLLECGEEANESVLHTCLDTYGHRISRDIVKTQCHWLAEQGLVSLNSVLGFLVVRITGRGTDVAEGLAKVPGVKRPRPRG